MAATDQITLGCPLCTQEHEYPITVERSISVGMAQPGAAPQSRRRSFVRLFTCPVRSSQFEATLTLSDTALDRIKEVSVGEPTSPERHG